jgi:hypothetical protein
MGRWVLGYIVYIGTHGTAYSALAKAQQVPHRCTLGFGLAALIDYRNALARFSLPLAARRRAAGGSEKSCGADALDSP